MPLRERLAKWLLGDEQPTQRVFGEPIAMVPSQMQWFGAGIGNQPDGSTLLKESSGVADMAQRAIANRIASLQLEVVASQRVADGTVAEEVLDDHPLALLLKRPHPDFSCVQLLRLTSQHITTAGEAYWLKVRTGLGKPQRLVPLYPHLVSPIVEGDVVTAYRVTDANGSVFGLSPEQVIRFRWVDPENLYGAEGYLAPNATATDTLKFAGEHLRQLYGNNAVPPAMVKAEAGAPMPDPATLKRWEREWVAKYHQRNGTQAGLPGWLPPGFDIIFTAMQTGADITPLLDYLDRLQLRNFGVPRSVLGEVVSGDRSSAETNQYVMDLHTVTPITMLIADVLTSQLAPDFDASLSVRFAQFVSSDKHARPCGHAVRARAQGPRDQRGARRCAAKTRCRGAICRLAASATCRIPETSPTTTSRATSLRMRTLMPSPPRSACVLAL